MCTCNCRSPELVTSAVVNGELPVCAALSSALVELSEFRRQHGVSVNNRSVSVSCSIAHTSVFVGDTAKLCIIQNMNQCSC